jgi:hypothetical protein
VASQLTIKAINPCSGGGHATIQITGDVTYSFNAFFGDIEEAVQAMTNEQMLAAIVRIARLTRTTAQTKAVLVSASGLAVTV